MPRNHRYTYTYLYTFAKDELVFHVKNKSISIDTITPRTHNVSYIALYTRARARKMNNPPEFLKPRRGANHTHTYYTQTRRVQERDARRRGCDRVSRGLSGTLLYLPSLTNSPAIFLSLSSPSHGFNSHFYRRLRLPFFFFSVASLACPFVIHNVLSPPSYTQVPEAQYNTRSRAIKREKERKQRSLSLRRCARPRDRRRGNNEA